jgi:hypothetical protein
MRAGQPQDTPTRPQRRYGTPATRAPNHHSGQYASMRRFNLAVVAASVVSVSVALGGCPEDDSTDPDPSETTTTIQAAPTLSYGRVTGASPAPCGSDTIPLETSGTIAECLVVVDVSTFAPESASIETGAPAGTSRLVLNFNAADSAAFSEVADAARVGGSRVAIMVDDVAVMAGPVTGLDEFSAVLVELPDKEATSIAQAVNG